MPLRAVIENSQIVLAEPLDMNGFLARPGTRDRLPAGLGHKFAKRDKFSEQRPVALEKLGQKDEAFSRIAMALTLNRNSQALMNSLGAISGADGRRLDLLRIHLPFSFQKISDASCDVILCGAEGEEWYEAAICYASWRMEKSLLAIDAAYKAAGRFDDISFLEPLRCEVLSAKARIAAGEKLGAAARRIVGIDESGFFEQLVFWDIRLRWEPLAAYGLDEGSLKRLLDYVGTWVAPRKPSGGDGNA